jgi:hypothetical protein
VGSSAPPEPLVLDWLLQGDPAIRWRVLRDLADADPDRATAERRHIATEGWGRRLLDGQRPDGLWSSDQGPKSHRGLYMPKWISTHYTLLLLSRLGLEPRHPAAAAGCRALLDRASWLPSGGIRLWTRDVTDVCVCAMVLSILQAFDQAPDAQARLRSYLLGVQLADGGWNCRMDSSHGSFHTTLSTLEALHGGPSDPGIDRAVQRGREFFLVHRLYCSHRTGEVARASFQRLPIPYSWHFDALRGLGHFASADAPRDDRLADAVAVLRGRRQPDGRWKANARASGQVHFELEPAGRPSRWVTMCCLEILRWWDGDGGEAAK